MSDPVAIEHQSLSIGKWANLLMAISGVTAAYLSHSDALLVDGLYSSVNFVSAIIAARVGASIARPADRRYPFGYDAHESLYVTFRSLTLIGILVFSAFGAVQKILVYASGGEVPRLVLGPILVYSILMVAICLSLSFWHRYNWRRSGEQSEVLKTESKAAAVDGAISAGAGAALLAVPLLESTVIAWIVPIADAIIVLILGAIIFRQPLQIFPGAFREVAGQSAHPEIVKEAQDAMERVLKEHPMDILEVVVTKMGRSYFVVPFLKPTEAIEIDEVDAIREELRATFRDINPNARVEIILTAKQPYDS